MMTKVMKMKIIHKIKNMFKKEVRLNYPDDFAIVKFSDIAFENGIKGDSNKIIKRYFYDNFGNLKNKKYRYSQERISVLREVLNIPIFDKTEEELTFPVIGKIGLGVIKFKSVTK